MERPWLNNYPANLPKTIDYTEHRSIASAIESTCKEFGGKDALICMGARLSFDDFNSVANHLATFLQCQFGLRKGDRIAIMLPNIMQFPIAFFAAQKAGLICVNTNPQYTHREMEHQFNDSGAKAIIILDLFADKLEKTLPSTQIEHIIITSIGDQLPWLKGSAINTILRMKGAVPKHGIRHTRFGDAIRQGREGEFTPVEFGYDDVAILQYTGGTTGVPKAAMLTQKNILANIKQVLVYAASINITSEEVVLTALPLYHIFALTVNFLSFLTLGGTAILVPKPIPIENTVKIFKEYRITVMTGVNTLFNALNHSAEFQQLAPKSIKLALAGGMALQDSVNREWEAITGNHILEGFGMTESSPVTHVCPSHILAPTGSIGLPLPSTDAKVIDENGNDLPIGEVGELTLSGPQVMKGYWNKPEETEKTIIDGWLRTGDIAKMDEGGFFFIVDRKKDMILVSGFNVFPNEVEEVIAAHEKVREVAVIGVPDAASGEKVVAYIIRSDNSLTEEEIRNYCRDQLTGYKRPREFLFVDEIPKSNIGKILRREIRDHYGDMTQK